MFGFGKRKKSDQQFNQFLNAVQEQHKDLMEVVASGGKTPDRTAALAAGRQRLDVFTQQLNTSVRQQLRPDIQLEAHLVLPQELWSNPAFDKFLFDDLGSTPFDMSNTLMMPKSEMNALLLGVPHLPTAFNGQALLQAHMYAGEAERAFKMSKKPRKDAIQEGRMTLVIHAMRMAAKTFGKAQVIRSRTLFNQDGHLFERLLEN